MKSVSCRYFTVYGINGVENHAIMAMIARAHIRQDPFEIWGDGSQIRNWTYVDDIVEGTILAAEKIDNAIAINLGTTERTSVLQAAHIITEAFAHRPRFCFLKAMPTGPINRVADNALAEELLGWKPTTRFTEGVTKTVNWYRETKSEEEARESLKRFLTER